MTVPATGVTGRPTCSGWSRSGPWPGPACRWPRSADLLDADPERFAAALADVQRRLTERIEELVARRDTLHRLAHGDRVLLPDRACAILDRLAELGFSPDYVAWQWEALVLWPGRCSRRASTTS